MKNSREKIKFSIIMPTYNRKFCISNAIDSLLENTYQNFELIIIDDASTDDTKEYIYRKYYNEINNKKINYIYLQHNCGPSNARNIALKYIKNEWVAYLDSDNVMRKNFLETFASYIKKYQNKKCFYAKLLRSDNVVVGHEFDYSKLHEANFIDIGVFIHHKDLIKKLGCFDINVKYCEDWDLILRYTKRYHPIFIDKILLDYSNDYDYKRITTMFNQTEMEEYINYIQKKNSYHKFSIRIFTQNIFSIKNIGIRKVLTVFGLKFKFKSQRLIDRKKIKELEIQYDTLKEEYHNYKQAQVIDKQEADKVRGKIYHYPINVNNLNDPRVYIMNQIKENTKVLDVGCACGELGGKLKELKNAEVIGLEYNSASIEIAKETDGYKNIIQCDLNKYKNIPLNEETFDYIVCGDVLEHIYEPQNVLNYFKQYLNEDGYFLLSIPNIAHASIKANLLLNNFDYTPMGLLDQTHIRFFTHKSVVNFLSELNLKIEDCKLTNFAGINGSQLYNPYPDLPQEIREFILKDKHSSIVQYVVKCKKSHCNNLIDINSEKIQSELDKTPYMQGVEEYICI